MPADAPPVARRVLLEQANRDQGRCPDDNFYEGDDGDEELALECACQGWEQTSKVSLHDGRTHFALRMHWGRRLILDLEYYHRSRTHQSLAGNSPVPRVIEPPARGQVVGTPVLGGLHQAYRRAA